MGGVTLSGGEPLAHPDLERLLVLLREHGLHCAVETSLHIPQSVLQAVVGLADLFIVDIKSLDATVWRDVLGGNLATFLANVSFLIRCGIRPHFRVLAGLPWTFTHRNVDELIAFIKEFELSEIELVRPHKLGRRKYESLGREMCDFPEVPIEELTNLARALRERAGVPVSVLT